MALKFHPLTSQSPKLPSFAMPQLASLRSPKFVMASTLRSTSRQLLFLFPHSTSMLFRSFWIFWFRASFVLHCFSFLVNSWLSSFASRFLRSLRRLMFCWKRICSIYYHLGFLFNCMVGAFCSVDFLLLYVALLCDSLRILSSWCGPFQEFDFYLIVVVPLEFHHFSSCRYIFLAIAFDFF